MMNNQDNKLTLSVLTFLFAGIALVYTMIQYHNVLFAVIGVSVIFLITAYLLTQNLIVWITMRNKSNSVQIKNLADDISVQLENMSSSQAAIGKSTYAYTKQTAKIITGLDEKYTESQEALFRSLSTIASNNNKATKLIVKYNQNNTSKTIAAMKDLRSQLNDILSQGFDQLQPDNSEIIDTLNALVDYLKSQSNNGMDSTMGLQLNNVAHELQNISNSIQHFQMPVATVMPTMAPAASAPQQAPVMPVTAPSSEGTPIEAVHTIEEALQADSVLRENAVADTEETVETPAATPSETNTAPAVEEAPADTFEAPITEASEAAMEEVALAEISDTVTETNETATETVAAEAETTVFEETSPKAPELNSDPEKLTQDDLDALLSSMNEITQEPAKTENTATDEADKPTFTVISNEEAEVSNTEAPVLDDPNKQLSADEIAALFAAAEPAPAKEEPAKEEPVAQAAPVEEAPSSDDPNKQLSADEIAALFAAAEPAPTKEEPAKVEAAPEPVAITPISDDPNKQLSADEIAALFAAAEPAPAKEEPAKTEAAPEPVAITPISDDPNKQLSADEIAALFAQMG